MHVHRTSATVTPADDKQEMLFDTYMILEQVKHFNLHNSTVTPLSRVLYLSTSFVPLYDIMVQNRSSLLTLHNNIHVTLSITILRKKRDGNT